MSDLHSSAKAAVGHEVTKVTATGSDALVQQEVSAATAAATLTAAALRNSKKSNDVNSEHYAANMVMTTTPTTTPTTTTLQTTTTTSAAMANATKQQSGSMILPLAVHYFVSFHQVCVITGLLPLVTLFTCFVTAYVFQYDDVHETHCRVYNIVPSISAITGVSPQRYFWRFSIAFHIGPRLPIAFIYKNYYRSMLDALRRRAPQHVPRASSLITLILVLNCIEILSLGGVTYISNRENYPIHEKIFITFMICSLCHMLATIKLNTLLFSDLEALTQGQRESMKWKKILFVVSIISTVGLLVFFAKHRFYCHDLAFSWFAFFEYLIAIANMLFHFTIIWDFPSQYMVVVQGPQAKIEQLLCAPKKWD